MPRDGSLVLSDVRAPTLTIVCEPCGRRGRYNVDRLIANTATRSFSTFWTHSPTARRCSPPTSMTAARRVSKGGEIASACKFQPALNLRPGTSMSL